MFRAMGLCLACWQGKPVWMLAIHLPSFWKKFKGCHGSEAWELVVLGSKDEKHTDRPSQCMCELPTQESSKILGFVSGCDLLCFVGCHGAGWSIRTYILLNYFRKISV